MYCVLAGRRGVLDLYPGPLRCVKEGKRLSTSTSSWLEPGQVLTGKLQTLCPSQGTVKRLRILWKEILSVCALTHLFPDWFF